MPTLAAVPTGSMVSPCCCSPCCIGDTLNILPSGIVLCDYCIVISDAPDPVLSIRFSNLIGLNEAQVITGTDCVYPWDLLAGTVDWQSFGSNDCSGDVSESGTADLNIELAGCIDGSFTWTIGAEFDVLGHTRVFGFFTSGFMPLDTANPNTATCDGVFAAHNGSITPSLP